MDRLLRLLVFLVVTVVANIHDNLNCGESVVADQYYVMTRSRFMRIVNGDDVRPGTWPWLGSLKRLGKHICGATLLDEYLAVTAAHCVAKYSRFNYLPGLYTIEFGGYDFRFGTSNQLTVGVSKIILHPLYNTPKMRSRDLALLVLSRGINLNSGSISPICLPTYAPLPGTHCVVAGWGRVDENSRSSGNSELLDASIPMMPTAVCADARHYMFLIDSASMLCAGFGNGGPDACQGDSGSPLMCMDPLGKQWQLHGIVSWGVGCGRAGRPGVYTNVRTMAGWIRTQAIVNGFAG